MKRYKLLTPGPLTTSDSVKKAMNVDFNTWDDEYKQMTKNIQKSILQIAGVNDDYTAVCMQGTGTFGVEATLTNLIDKHSKVLVISNGTYGGRIIEILQYAKLNYTVYEENSNQIPDPAKVEHILSKDKDITHVLMVHCETASGILNPLEEVAEIVHKYNKVFIADGMSSFGGVPIDMENIDALIASPNKCIQGVPGFSIIVAKKELLEKYKGNSTTTSLNLYEQYKTMEEEGKWRFTSPTHTVIAFQKALEEFFEEGGVFERNKRYANNQKVLANGMEELGFQRYVPKEYQSPIITTFLYPENKAFNYNQMYEYLKERGYAMYPRELTEVNGFRIGNIGELYEEDMYQVVNIIEEFMEKTQK